MSNENYLKELKKRLSILDESEINEIIAEYEDYIEQKICDGYSTTMALDSLGNVNDLARSILKAYKISDRYIKWFIGKEKFIDDLNDFTDKIADTSMDVLSKIENTVTDFAKGTKEVMKTAYKETKKFSENRINDVKSIFRKKGNEYENTQSTNNIDENINNINNT